MPQFLTRYRSALQGESDKALPLYERALDIYERHYGEEHPEVAHTLTDLAVLHLEQVGRGAGPGH